MKWHVLRPLWVAIGLVASILVARIFLVPDDFGIHGQSFTYGFYRKSNVQEWKDFAVKYQGREYCVRCHKERVEMLSVSSHAPVECENCHGPGVGHPREVKALPIDTRREHCLRCHSDLGYGNYSRASMPIINGNRHGRRRECVTCHNPHNPGGED